MSNNTVEIEILGKAEKAISAIDSTSKAIDLLKKKTDTLKLGDVVDSNLERNLNTLNDTIGVTQEVTNALGKDVKGLNTAFLITDSTVKLLQVDLVKFAISVYRNPITSLKELNKRLTDLTKEPYDFSRLQEALGHVKEALKDVSDYAKIAFEPIKRGAKEAGSELLKLGVSLGVAGKIEKDFEQVARLLNASSSELKTYKQNLLALGVQLGVNQSELFGLAEAAAQAGYSIQDSIPFIETVIKASQAWGISAQEAGEQIAGLRTQVGDAFLGNLELFTDKINALGDEIDGVTEGDLLNVLNRGILSLGKTFGLTADEASALSAAILSMKAPPEVAASSLRSLLTTLATIRTSTGEVKEAIESLGIGTNQFADQIKNNAGKALTDFLKRISQLEGEQKLTVIEKLIGKGEDAQALVKLTGNTEVLAEALKLLSDNAGFAGGVNKAFQAQLGSLFTQLERLKNAVLRFTNALGEPFLAVASMFISAIADIINAVAALGETVIGEFAVIVAKVISIVAPLGLIFGTISKAILTLRGNVGFILPALAALTARLGILFTTLLGGIPIIVRFGSTLLLWSSIITGWSTRFVTLSAAIGAAFANLAKLIKLSPVFIATFGRLFSLLGGWITVLITAGIYFAEFLSSKDDGDKTEDAVQKKINAIVAIEDEIEKLKDSLKQADAAYAESFAQLKKRLDDALRINAERYKNDVENYDRAQQEKLAILERSFEDAAIIEQKSNDIILESNAEKIKIAEKYRETNLQIIEDVYATEIEKAKDNKERVETLTLEKEKARQGILKDTENAYKESIDVLIAKEKELKDKSSQYAKDSYQTKKDALQKLKDLENAGLNDKLQNFNREKQIKENEKRIDELLNAGKKADALKLAQETQKLAEESAAYQTGLVNKQKSAQLEALADENELLEKKRLLGNKLLFLNEYTYLNPENSEKLKELREEYKKTVEEINKAQVKESIGININRLDKDAANIKEKTRAQTQYLSVSEKVSDIEAQLSAANDLEAEKVTQQIAEQQRAIDTLKSDLMTIDELIVKPKSLNITTDEANKNLDAIAKKIDKLSDKKVTLEVELSKEIKANQSKEAPLGIKGLSLKNWTFFATGGQVPGSGTGDTVPAMLTPGEFVINKLATQRLTPAFLQSLNSGIVPQGYASGGMVTGGATSPTVSINLNLGGTQTTGIFPDTQATKLIINELKKAGRVQ